MINQRVMATAIIRKGNRYLLLKRSRRNKMYSGQWQFPEGGVEFGETPLEALKRELHEETGLNIRKAKLLGVGSGTIKYFHRGIYHFIRVFYECRVTGKLKLSDKHTDAAWLTKKEIGRMKLLKGFRFSEAEKII
ncbi:MAG: NUDIX domain-containing protein [Candidatus Aenigmatarchaeota archaeon]